MATFDIEHRINRRQAELASDRSRRLARRGVQEAMDFARPRPRIITADEGQIPESAFRGPSFANVQSAASTVAGTRPATGPQRRGAPRTEIADAVGAVAAPNIASPAAEKERQQRLEDVSSAIRDMTIRPSGLNMASKRRMFTELMSQRNELTGQAYEGQNRRNIAQGDIAARAAIASADNAERAAGRRDRGAMFDAEIGDRRFEYDTNRRDAYDAAVAAAPRNALEMEKLRTEIDVNKANATRIADEYTRKAPSIGDDVLEPRIAALREANPNLSYADARAQAVAAYQASGADAEASTVGQENRQALARRLGGAFNPDNIPLLDWRTLGDKAAIGSSLSPDQIPAGAIEDPRAVRATRLGAVRRLLTPGADFRFEVQGPNGPRAVYSDDESLFNDLQEYQRAFRDR